MIDAKRFRRAAACSNLCPPRTRSSVFTTRRRASRVLLSLAAISLAATAAVALPAQAATAAPVQAPAVPQAQAVDPFDVLVFSKTAGFRHDAIPAGVTAIQQLGAANGFTVDTTEDAGA